MLHFLLKANNLPDKRKNILQVEQRNVSCLKSTKLTSDGQTIPGLAVLEDLFLFNSFLIDHVCYEMEILGDCAM